MTARLLLTALLLAGAAPGRGASAHAVLLESEPAPRAAVAPGPAGFALRFNGRIDRARSRLTLLRPDRTEAVLRIEDGGPPDVLRARAEGLRPGAHVLRWQVLAVDGHITRGDVRFTVAPPPPSGPVAGK